MYVRASLQDNYTLNLLFTKNLSDSLNFEQFVSTQQLLKPLLGTVGEMKKNRLNARKLAITTYQPQDKVYIDLRYYDGETTAWFDSIDLPHSMFSYVVEGLVVGTSKTNMKLYVTVGIYASEIILDHWDIMLYCYSELENIILVTEEWFERYPRLTVGA